MQDEMLTVFEADLGDINSVCKAIEGSTAVFGVTNCKMTLPPSTFAA